MTSIEWTADGYSDAALALMAEQTGLAGTLAGGGRLVVDVVDVGGPVYDRVHRRLSNEHFRVGFDRDDPGRVTIEISSRRGLRWAMVDLARRRE